MDFNLPKADIDFLDCHYQGKWRTVTNELERGIIINDYSLPDGYNRPDVEMMILIPPEYPMASLDMFYLFPGISKTSGRGINALIDDPHFGKQWQRWSRHYSWEPGVHNLATHLQVVENALIDELNK